MVGDTQIDALQRIHSDLENVRRRRWVALGVCTLIVAIFFGVTVVRGGDHSPMWWVSFGMLLCGALLGASITLGVPRLSRKLVYVVGGLMTAGCLGALGLVVQPHADHTTSMPCFMYGTGISAVAMVVLGLISGSVWRRFPDPSFVLAMGATGIGLAALHVHCPAVDALHLFGFHLGPLVVIYALSHFVLRARERILRDD